jgi:tripeptide aminopeptidase
LAETVRNEIPAEVEADVLERFLRYVRVDTQSDPGSTTYPSTAKQRDVGELLARELRELGLSDAAIDEHGYVFATVPGAAGPTVGLIAHVDTSPDESGENVDPQVVRGYDGGDLQLPGDPRQAIRPGESTVLAEKVGHDIVTTDGTTLLGADDKAGVAEIMAAVAYLLRHPEVEHAPIRVAFTVDEEVGSHSPGVSALRADESPPACM